MNSDTMSGFFPTPKPLIHKMLSGIDFRHVDSVLEPSAGKGDLADEIRDRMASAQRRGYRSEYMADIDTIEINPDLQHVLKGNGHRVIYNDFLNFQTYKHYSLVVMNPPFMEGDKHLLKAIEIMERGGGAIICLLNSLTVREPRITVLREELFKKLQQYNAEITHLPDEFRHAERQTNVGVALIKIIIPRPENKSIILDELEKTKPIREVDIDSCQALAENDFIRAAVDQFDYEARAGLQLIRDYKAILPLISSSIDGPSAVLKLTLNDHRASETANENEFLRRMRKKYWGALFLNPRFSEKFTSNLLEKCRSDVDRLADYDFNAYNINSIRLELSADLIKATEDTITGLFDELTYQHSWYNETSKNRHYFNGWFTNRCWIINKKAILPLKLYGYLTKNIDSFNYRTKDKISDIDKTLRYLAWDKSDHVDAMQTLDEARERGQTKDIQFDYFKITCYKKGTTHITFTDAELLKKFNLFGCQKKNWLPPVYGKMRYADMADDEKAVIDSFEGRESYEQVLTAPNYYLTGPNLELPQARREEVRA